MFFKIDILFVETIINVNIEENVKEKPYVISHYSSLENFWDESSVFTCLKLSSQYMYIVFCLLV